MKPIIELVTEWENYTAVSKSQSVEEFCKYYLNKKETGNSKEITDVPNASFQRGSLLRVMGRLLSAYALYMRAALVNLQLPAPESFYYLNGLAHLGEVRKSDLINYLFAETTTGMEAINKLVRVKMISERTSPDDKRAKLIKLTTNGKQALDNSYGLAGKAAEMILVSVSTGAIAQCYELLKDSEQKQSKLVIDVKNKDFDEMYEYVINKAE
jgi:DNA-binding MarR family transcriptional regulator